MNPLTVLTDCAHDAVAVCDISTRWTALTGASAVVQPLPIGLRPEEHARTTSVASVAIYRALLAGTTRLGQEGKVFGLAVNGAPRDGMYPNGVPFCSFRYKNGVVTAPLNADVLRMARRYLGITTVTVHEVKSTMDWARSALGGFDGNEVNQVTDEKFRSLWFQLPLQHWLQSGISVPGDTVEIPVDEDDETLRVGFVDGFGNVFLACMSEETGFEPGQTLLFPRYDKHGRATGHTRVQCRERFEGLAMGDYGLILGHGMPMLVVGCESAATKFHYQPGMRIELG